MTVSAMARASRRVAKRQSGHAPPPEPACAAMPSPKVRLKDIAEATRFSVNTVSLALRRSPRLPKETRDLILAEAKRQNYLPNRVAPLARQPRRPRRSDWSCPTIINPTLTARRRNAIDSWAGQA